MKVSMRKRILFLISFLLFCSFAFGADLPKSNITFTDRQIEILAEAIRANTPENTHFSKETTFKWVYLVFDSSIPENLKDQVIKRFSKDYIVYLSYKDIPIENIRKTGDYTIGYEEGFSFSLKMTNKNENTIEVFFEDVEGNRAASGFSIVYSWNGETWTKIGGDEGWIS
jgi:hypothetical protein